MLIFIKKISLIVTKLIFNEKEKILLRLNLIIQIIKYNFILSKYFTKGTKPDIFVNGIHENFEVLHRMLFSRKR